MEVEVEELWTSTVTSIPTTSPATGLERIAFSWKMSPATLPVGRDMMRGLIYEQAMEKSTLQFIKMRIWEAGITLRLKYGGH